MIESYSFGKMKINSDLYSKDLIVFPDRIDSPWRRKSGHCLELEDIQAILEENPEVLIVGTGYAGRMKVNEDLIRKCRELDIELIIKKTKTAMKEFNKYCSRKKTCGAFHLTC
ncbi:MAG: MTH938/NDUFAF3 family protein [Candidatus Aminicenantes bacterium]